MVDTRDLKSLGSNPVKVRVLSRAFNEEIALLSSLASTLVHALLERPVLFISNPWVFSGHFNIQSNQLLLEDYEKSKYTEKV